MENPSTRGRQADLFTDQLGHPRSPLQALGAYCHFAVIHRRTRIGLPLPAVLVDAHRPLWDAALNTLLHAHDPGLEWASPAPCRG